MDYKQTLGFTDEEVHLWITLKRQQAQNSLLEAAFDFLTHLFLSGLFIYGSYHRDPITLTIAFLMMLHFTTKNILAIWARRQYASSYESLTDKVERYISIQGPLTDPDNVQLGRDEDAPSGRPKPAQGASRQESNGCSPH